jgi:PAS domain S-box-containing protein
MESFCFSDQLEDAPMTQQPTDEKLDKKVEQSARPPVQQEAPLETGDRYRLLLDSITDGCWVLDKKWRYTMVNEAGSKFVDKSRDELVGHKITSLFPDIKKTEFFAAYERSMKKRTTERVSAPFVFPDGRKGFYEVRVYPVAEGILCVGADITERKRVEEALRDSENRYRSIFENILDVYYRADLEGNLIEVSPSGVKLLGYDSSEEMIGKNIAKQFYADPQEREHLKSEIMKHGKIRFQGTLKRKDGTLVVTETNSRLIYDETGKPVAIEGIFRDITDEKRAAELARVNKRLQREVDRRKRAEQAMTRREQEFRLLAENVPGLFSYVGADGCYRFVNKHYEEWFSLPAESVVGKHYREVLGEKTYAAIRHHVEAALSGHRVRYEDELPYKHGGTRWVMADYLPNTDETGSPKGFFALVTDVTERRLTEKALESRLGLEQMVASVSTRFVNLAPDEIDDGINYALETMGVFAGVDRSYVFLFHDNWTRMDNTHEWCAKGVEPQIDKLQGLAADAVPWWMRQLNRFENIHIPRVAELPPEASAEKEILQSQDIQSLVVVPIVHGSRLIGFIGFDSVRAEKTWPQETFMQLQLMAEIFANALERKRAQKDLWKSNEKLKAQTNRLEQMNSALNVLLERRGKDREELEEKMVSNVKELILPYIESLKKTPLNAKQMTCVDIVETNLREIVSPFLRKLASEYFGLTPKEIRVAGLVKRGKTTKEISEFLGVSTRAVQFHRNNIRAKLGLKNQRVNLGTYLLSLS